MARVVVTFSIMPESPDVDLKDIETKSLEKIKSFAGTDDYKVSVEPIAFGLKAVKIMFVMDEDKGSTDDLEADIETIDGVNSVEVTDVRRAIG
ncbi:TPA: elongation factor 1-beta [Candidatus Woesearchaeota archaeon]|nr:Elongation factor 1-beta [archaeon GW2011_AR15]MBS3103801.1 elongation factor 1-beta [Candidatus Woesearchaeota archaeon]HIH41910.1 elongation factor 1-beta [Candidatus Woesearchaeota archaeon]